MHPETSRFFNKPLGVGKVAAISDRGRPKADNEIDPADSRFGQVLIRRSRIVTCP